jgi:hypothetical protein
MVLVSGDSWEKGTKPGATGELNAVGFNTEPNEKGVHVSSKHLRPRNELAAWVDEQLKSVKNQPTKPAILVNDTLRHNPGQGKVKIFSCSGKYVSG